MLRTAMRRSAAEEWALVLASQGLRSRIRPLDHGVALEVAAADAERAERALRAWESENPPPEPKPEPAPHVGPASWRAAILVSSALLVVFRLTTGAGADAWIARGAADAERILAGETWRTVTALTLHADLGHVLANAISCAFFLTALGRSVGPGLAVALAVLCGAAGNLANALVHGSDHVSVGASTAIFAVLGILAGQGVARHERRGARGSRAWTPIAAGVALIAMLGTGERADLWAHALGFACGGVAGVVVGRALRRPPQPVAQWCWGLGSLALVAGCWDLALEPGLSAAREVSSLPAWLGKAAMVAFGRAPP